MCTPLLGQIIGATLLLAIFLTESQNGPAALTITFAKVSNSLPDTYLQALGDNSGNLCCNFVAYGNEIQVSLQWWKEKGENCLWVEVHKFSIKSALKQHDGLVNAINAR